MYVDTLELTKAEEFFQEKGEGSWAKAHSVLPIAWEFLETQQVLD